LVLLLYHAFEEVIAEKVRALAQRARPRDLYDVVHFFRNRDLISNTQLVFNTLQKKCSYKGIETPKFKHIEEHEKLEELEYERDNWDKKLFFSQECETMDAADINSSGLVQRL